MAVKRGVHQLELPGSSLATRLTFMQASGLPCTMHAHPTSPQCAHADGGWLDLASPHTTFEEKDVQPLLLQYSHLGVLSPELKPRTLKPFPL
jgi:hypothetical protein